MGKRPFKGDMQLQDQFLGDRHTNIFLKLVISWVKNCVSINETVWYKEPKFSDSNGMQAMSKHANRFCKNLPAKSLYVNIY